MYRCQDIRKGWKPSPETRLQAMQEQYDPKIDAFRCFYSRVPLRDDVFGDRRSAEWEHRNPPSPHDVVLAAKVVNAMKSDLSESEFRALVLALGAHFAGEPFDEDAFPVSRI